jgi:hypothetical protein
MLGLANNRQIMHKLGSHYIEPSNLETHVEIPE